VNTADRLNKVYEHYRKAYILGEPDIRHLLEELVLTVGTMALELEELQQQVDRLKTNHTI
jgi:hypothetical protein